MDPTLFRKAAVERLSSPDDLDDVIAITDGGFGWTLLAALLLSTAGAVWALAGSLPVTVSGPGVIRVAEGGALEAWVCLPVTWANQVRPGLTARVSSLTTTAAGSRAMVSVTVTSVAHPHDSCASAQVHAAIAAEQVVVRLELKPAARSVPVFGELVVGRRGQPPVGTPTRIEFVTHRRPPLGLVAWVQQRLGR